MAENVRPPVAVRIVRPFQNEEDFLESELETVGKTSVILIGAHPRPTGVILRFEVTLASGQIVLRGEGRVLSHKENAFRGQPGLSLRFTRLDPKSKALVDRAGAIREARLAGEGGSIAAPPGDKLGTEPKIAPPASQGSMRPNSFPALTLNADAIAEALGSLTPAPMPATAGAPEPEPLPPPPPAPEPEVEAEAEARAPETVPDPAAMDPAPPPREPFHKTKSARKVKLTPPPLPVAPPSDTGAPSEPAAIPRVPSPPSPPPPPPVPKEQPAAADRESILARLRSRHAALSPDRILEILSLPRSN